MNSIKLYREVRVENFPHVPGDMKKIRTRKTLISKITALFVIGFAFVSMFGFTLQNLQTARAASAPNIVSYQGRILNTNSVPVADASLEMKFEFYTAVSGGTCLWSNSSVDCDTNTPGSTVARSVTLTGGLFSELLGDTTAGTPYAGISDTLFADNAGVYLQVYIAGEALSPRKQIASVPYALNADTLDGADSTTFLTATGDTATGNHDYTGAIFMGASPLVFEGLTDDTNQTTFAFVDPTGTRTVTFKDESGTVAYLSDISGIGSKWTDGGAVTYLTSTTDGLAVGGTGFASASFGIDEANNTIYIGEGANSNGNIVFKASNAATGTLTYGTADSFDFTGGNITTDGNLALNGGNLTSTSTAFNFDIGNTGSLLFRDGTNTLMTLTDAGTTGSLGISGDLTVTGGDITLGTTSIFSGGDTASLNNIDAIDATTKTTIQTAITALANLTSATSLTSVGTLSGLTVTGFSDFTGATMVGASPLVFDGVTADVNKTTFAFTDPTGVRTVTFKDESGTVALLSDIALASSKWTDGGAVTYLTSTTDGLAVGGTGFASASFGIDEANNTIYIGEGANSNGNIVFKASNAATGTLTYGTADSFDFTGGNITTDGNLALNGGNLTSTSTAFNFDIGNTGSLLFRDGTNTLMTLTDAGTTGNLTITGDLGAVGGSFSGNVGAVDATLSGNLAVNGGTISSTATAFNIDVGNTGSMVFRDGTNTLMTLTDAGTTGDLTTSGDVIVSGGDITLGTTSIFSGGDTASLNNVDALDATTVTTVQNAITSLPNLTSATSLASVGTLTTGATGAGFTVDLDASTLTCTDCLDFTSLADSMTLDASLAIAQGTNTWTNTYTGTIGNGFTYNANLTTTGTAQTTNVNGLTTGTGMQLSSLSSARTSGDLMKVYLSSPYSAGATVSGNILDAGQLIYNNSTGAVDVTGETALIARTTTTQNAAATTSVTGAVASISNSASQLLGILTDTSNVLKVSQNYASATGAVLQIDNAGSGYAISANSAGFTVASNSNIATNGDLTVAGGDITLGTTSIFSGGDTASLNNIDALDATTVNTVQNAITSLPNLTSATSLASVGTLTTGATGAGFTVNLDASTLTCTDCLDFANLADSMTLDAAQSIVQGNYSWTDYYLNTTGVGRYYNANFLQNYSAAVYTANGIIAGGVLKLQSSSAVRTSGKLFVIDNTATYTTPATVSGSLNDLNQTLTNETGGLMTISGNTVNISRSSVSNIASANTVVTGAVMALSNNATETIGLVNDSGSILTLTQNYANSTGAVLKIDYAGTGNAIQLNSPTSGDLAINGGNITSTSGMQFSSSSYIWKDLGANTLMNLTDAGTTGNLGVTGDISGVGGTFSGNVAVNGGTLSSTATTFNIDVGNTGSMVFRDGTNTLMTLADTGTTGNLTTTGDVIVSGGDITLGATSIFSGGDIASLNNIDALNATTTTTIQNAITSLPNLTSATSLASVGTLTTGATGAGFTVNLDASTLTCTDCLDFANFADSMTLDASTTINAGTSNLWLLSSAGTNELLSLTNFRTDSALGIVQGASLTATTPTSTDGGVLHVVNTLNNNIGLSVYSDHAGSATAPLSYLFADNAAFDQNVVQVTNDGVKSGIMIDQNGNTGIVLSESVGGALHVSNSGNLGSGITAYSNISGPNAPLVHFATGSTYANQATMYVSSAGASSPALGLESGNTTNLGALTVYNSSNTGVGLLVDSSLGATASYPLSNIISSNVAFDQSLLRINNGSLNSSSAGLEIAMDATDATNHIYSDALKIGYNPTINTASGLLATGNAVDVSRTLANNGAGSLNISGALMTLSDSASTLGGLMMHTAPMIQATQNVTYSTGDLISLTNNGVGSGIDIVNTNNVSGAGIVEISALGLTSGYGFNIKVDASLLSTGAAYRVKAATLLTTQKAFSAVANTTETIYIETDGDIHIPAGSICIDNDASCTSSTDGTIYYRSAVTTGGDLAEVYESTEVLQAGDIIVIDSANPLKIKQSTSPYEQVSISVVATNPGNLMNGPTEADLTAVGIDPSTALPNWGNYVLPPGSYPVALAGRVPTRVNTENGAIAVGDLITTSSTAGAGMKSTMPGAVVGRALQAWNGPGEGVIEVYILSGWHSGGAIANNGTMGTLNNNFALTAISQATATTTGQNSNGLFFQGSGWDGTTAQAVDMVISNDVTDSANYKLSVKNDVGAEVAYISQSGDIALSGKLYPSDRGTLQTSKYIFYDGSAGPGGDFMRTNASGWATGSYDFAEMFPSNDRVVPGEVVVFANDNQTVQRSTGVAYDRKLVGIISTRPGFLAGENLDGHVPVALAGRVPTFVSNENGTIAPGDPLTTSSTPGYAMKATEAGPILGYAMEPFNGTMGSIITFVRASYYDGGPVVDAPATNNIASGLTTTSNLDVSGTLNLNAGNIINVSSIAGLGNRWIIKDNGDLITEGRITHLVKSYQNTDVETYASLSRETTIQLSGTATLHNGTAVIKFEDIDPEFNDVISNQNTYRVFLTASEATNSLYALNRTIDGFTIQESNGNSNAVIDWLVIAYHKDYAPTVIVPDNIAPQTATSTPAVIASPSATTTPVITSTPATVSPTLETDTATSTPVIAPVVNSQPTPDTQTATSTVPVITSPTATSTPAI
ncbi:hypothetical protein CO173_00415 [Candidatus Uhrbacteria bacterium CG_4_9_14_3_um_filter_41_35]|uniref:Uncharacterized protein n=1 Tax=Candidatus Uhrbacteria bacterium CG_4_9_14_3_um_filter_41_35 TaxID=1975034 RepID=A0A2M7XGM7_9BACT|nr:MAG: hypothetical protein CO173_00415 [Candidatus Uhrbacteria bacterium CG_4_9_14_3_um_filter_41_35]